MIVPDFVIPLRLTELEDDATSHELGLIDLGVSDIAIRLNIAADAESADGAEFIVDNFSTFYQLCKKFKDVPNHVKEKGYKILFKSFKKLTVSLEGLLGKKMEPEDQRRMCNVVKMLGYMLIEVAKKFQDFYSQLVQFEAKTKGKKNVKNEGLMDWVEVKTQLINEIYTFLQLPLKMLWDPPVVNEEFIQIFANFCYKCLEDTSITGVSMKPFRTSIFQVFATLIRRYLHGMNFCVRVVQLLRLNDHLVNPLAQGVVEIINNGCNHVVYEIVRVIDEESEQLLTDTSTARGLSQFLSSVAESAPEAVNSAVDLIMVFLCRDPPILRCGAVSVLGEIIQALLTKENLEQDLKEKRDGYLEALEEHIHDTNAFVRSRVLQVWQKLCLAKAIPVIRMHNLLELVIGRLGDKSALVKKQAVQLIKVILEGNPYSGQLDIKEITTQLEQEQKKLTDFLQAHNFEDKTSDWANIEKDVRKALNDASDSNILVEGLSLQDAFQKIWKCMKEANFSDAVAVLNQLKREFYDELKFEGDDDVETSLQVLQSIWNRSYVPEVSAEILEKKEALERGVTYLEGALEFAKLIDRALPLILTFLESSAQTDVLEAISFFTAAFQFGFSKALDGVRRMLYLVFSKESSIKTAVCNAYQDLYFSSSSGDRKRSVEAVKLLSELIVQLNLMEMKALQEIVKEWVKSGVIDKSCIQVLFERFSLKISGTSEVQSWAAITLISMIGVEQPKTIRNNISVIVNEGLGPRAAKNFILAQYSCRALQKLTEGSKLTADDEILMRIRRLLRDGLWESSIYYTPFADEALSLVFLLAERPDKFSEELIIELYNTIKSEKRPISRQPRGRILAHQKNEDLFDLDEKQPEKEFFEEETVDADMSSKQRLMRLTRFLSILGTIASHFIGFLESRVLGELKRRNLCEFERKLKRQQEKLCDTSMVDREELELRKVAADDICIEQIKKLKEENIVSGGGLLAKFMPLIQNILKHPMQFPFLPLQNAALLALGRFMQVSSKICEENLQLLMTLTTKSKSPAKRRNGLLLLWSLQFRFPNTCEPWIPHMFGMLKDEDSIVRGTALQVLTHLILNDMIKARANISDLALCIVDADLAQATRQFFREYAQKSNVLFNVLPTLISTLTNPNLNLDEEKLHTIMQFLLQHVSKDKHHELLIEKLCLSFESTTTDRQCRDLAFCLGQLQCSEKALTKVLENWRCFGNKLYVAEVYEVFTNMTSVSKNSQKDKATVEELQALIRDYREKCCADRNISVVIPSKRCPASSRKRAPRRKQYSSESEEEDAVPKSAQKGGSRKKSVASDTENLTSDSDNEVFTTNKPRGKKIAYPSSDSDSGEVQRKHNIVSKTASAKKSRTKTKVVKKSDGEDSNERKILRTTRKRR